MNASPPPQKPRILVVDDEPDITSVLKRGLEKHGFAVDIFNDPMEALKHFKPDYYDLVLLDIRMPRISGFELYRRLKDKDAKARFFFLTAFEMYVDEFKKVFPSMDIQQLIRKPVHIDELVKIISS